jgi:DNA-directed RNA polymerase specialized sigma24 family protein
VHHTYLRILRLKGVKISNVMINPMGYFRRAMFIESTRGEFKKEYEIKDSPQHHIYISNYDLSQAFLLENFQLAVDRLSWFDKTILNLYCDGFNLTQVARESGIKISTVHTSLHRSRKKLKAHFNSRTSI